MNTIDRPFIRPELLAILACPVCKSSDLKSIVSEAPQLCCESCGTSYGFNNDIPLLYKNDFAWAPKQREAEGWVEMWKDMAAYNDEHPIYLDLPFGVTVEPWITMEQMFRAALFQMNLRGGEKILDIGAGEGWASQQFATRGAHAVAIDVVPDGKLGLGRAWKRMGLTNAPFDLIIGDNENLPLQPNSFDIVFASNALHHHDHLDKLFSNIYRVLKPGGRLISIGEPLITIYQRESDTTDGDRERAFGIIERRRRFYHYILALWQAGFRNIHADDHKTFWKNNADLYAWMDIERYAIEEHTILGSKQLTKLLTRIMLRLPRPFAVWLLLCLRQQGTLLLNVQKPL